MWRLSVSILLFLYLTASSYSEETCSGIVPLRYRNDKISITEFGGVGDGRTVNTKAFRAAIYRIQHLRRRGGTLLYIPPGVYLTESFNLTSHMTLYLARGAVIRAVQDTWNWPLIDPLPSYGRGRELPGGRYMSFIHGDGLHDVVITGQNGTIDGQGEVWWNMWRSRTLKFTRPNLIEFKNSKEIIISNVIFQNSPFWNIHPVYCSNVVIHHVTILAPQDSPNTDGIDPDSSVNVCIEDSYISTGDDLVAIKSGWDEYGIAFGRPSSNITIRRITGSSPFAGIAIGSETSGGIKNIVAEHITLSNMGVGVNIKTNIGRGGYIKNIKISDVYVDTAKYGIKIAGDTGDHPDAYYNPNALPVVKGIHIKNVWGVNVRNAGSIQGLKGSPFTGKDMLSWEQKTLLSELLLGLEAAKKLQARLRQAPSSSFSSPAAATAETNEILMKQIVSSYERSVLMLNWSPSVQLIPAPVTLVPVENSGGVPESPASINESPRSEEFADGGGSSESHHRQDYIFNSKKRKMLPKWSEKVRISPERGLEGPQDDVFSWRKYGQKDILGAKFPRSYYRCTHRSTQNCWATKQVQRSDSDPTVFEVTYRGTHTCSQAIAPPPPPASPEKQKDTITQKPKDLLQSLKSNLTVQTDGLDDGKDVFSFPDTPPFYTYDTINGDFSHVESSPIFDVVDWFNPTVEIDTTFPTFLHESIYF